jgi:hypothetical protein
MAFCLLVKLYAYFLYIIGLSGFALFLSKIDVKGVVDALDEIDSVFLKILLHSFC